MVLQNCTTDCPPPFNTELNGVFTVSASLQFYPATSGAGRDGVPDVVLPLEQSNGSGGLNLPAFLFLPTDQFSTTFTLPTNIEQVYLDVVSQSQSTDEQWYGCFPNDLSNINEVYGCGNTDFRETEITIDGQPAGIAPVSPWVYTGFLPDQWVPSPGVQTLDFVPYRVNLTPFAGLLSDGNPHTVSLSMFNDDSFFSETASLLLFLDKGSSRTTGALLKNSTTAPSPLVTGEPSWHRHGHRNDRREVRSPFHDCRIREYVPRKGRDLDQPAPGFFQHAKHRLQAHELHRSQPEDVCTYRRYVRHNSVEQSGICNYSRRFQLPNYRGLRLSSKQLSVRFYGFHHAQGYEAGKKVTHNGDLVRFTSVTNSEKATDVSPAMSSQIFTEANSSGLSYDCHITSKDNTLTKVSQGCTPKQP